MQRKSGHPRSGCPLWPKRALFRCVLLLAEVQLAHTLHLVADGLEVAGAAVGGHTLQDLAETHGDIPDRFGFLLQSGIVRVRGGDENQLHRQNVGILLRVQKRRFSSKGGARTFWESGFSKPVKKSIKDVKSVTLASSDLPRRETTRGTIAYRKNRKLGKPSTHD